MAAVTNRNNSAGLGSWWDERNNQISSKLLEDFTAAEPAPDGFIPHHGVPSGGDIPKPTGLFADSLIGPKVWPLASEAALLDLAAHAAARARSHGEAAEEARALSKRVFDSDWPAGVGAEAAAEHYKHQHALHDELADAWAAVATEYNRLGEQVRSTKRLMRDACEEARRKIEAFLRSPGGRPVNVGPILIEYRNRINEFGGMLHTGVAHATTRLLGKDFAATPPPTGGGNQTTHGDLVPDETPPQDGELVTRGEMEATHGDLIPGNGTPLSTHGDLVSGPGSPSSPAIPGSPLRMSVPQVSPIATSGVPTGGGGLLRGAVMPLSGLLGAGGMAGTAVPAGGMNTPAVQSPPSAMPSLSADFGRGVTAGVSAAGTATPASAPVPQPPPTRLAAPIHTAPASAAPAAGPAPASAPMPAPQQARPGGSASAGAGQGMAPYGSVLTPPASAGSFPSASAAPPPAVSAAGGGVPAGPAGTSTPGLVSVAGRRDGAEVRRDLAESDLELARMAVAELAGAACLVDAGLDWAVAVGRNASGLPTLWVATNDGATYIPPGVYLRKTMPVAAQFDDDFDARWLGWVNPAEKAVRAARARGDAVGAVATTWAWPSEYLEVSAESVREVAIGVPALGADSPATELLASRSHRLQTVDAALYADVKAADESAVRDYCRELVRRLAFGGTGDELSPVAQSVADALAAQRWPKTEEWAALSAEYDTALILMGAQRPGLNGVEDPNQVFTYAKLFVNCRRLEALLCWRWFGADLSNVVYAAWVAGVRAPLNDCVRR